MSGGPWSRGRWSPPRSSSAPGVAVLHNMSSPPRTPIPSAQRSVWGPATLFSLGHALAAHGLLPSRAGETGPFFWSDDLARQAQARWGNRIEALLEAASTAGSLDMQRLAQLEDGGFPSGALIGWRPMPINEGGADLRPCTDIALTIVVLERRVGDLYLATRHPDRSWRQLFAQTLAVDDPRFVSTQRKPQP